ncbi:dipeptidyl-peptidase 3 family protein [Natronospira bacteriovora]|uniref:Zn-dependent hydrolase n=1 Tax=Natronospira bacteriovora TaxID=3069753 RepID=A0ABU0W752_9GAMM|nr:Zn-dependent hydrolase [Natronospira sp. AB-CW4]MDQ2069583.1 Zn-dependent hydrolase [Natronospira sp. AB-CW4]
MYPRIAILTLLSALLALGGCERDREEALDPATQKTEYAEDRVSIYAPYRLETGLDHLTDNQRDMLLILMEIGDIMDDLFWVQAWGDREALMARIDNEAVRRFAEINYGPWDRLGGGRPFVPEVGERPRGANYYPRDMSREEFQAADLQGKDSLYTMIRRDETGRLVTIPYSEYFAGELQRAAQLMREAAELAEYDGFRDYLLARAEAFETDEYYPSDVAWMTMRDNDIEFVVGPIETYEDRLFGNKAAFEAFVLIRDREWSERLQRFADYLPDLQAGLPVPPEYRQESPGTDADLGAYDAIYYSGDANAGAKTIAINLPNDERVQQEQGTRRLQIRNAMQAKFDKIVVPIADTLIVPDQREHVIFDAFFGNVMFHEVAHGLGLNFTLDGETTVRQALQEHAAALEEAKADILGLHMITELLMDGRLDDASLQDYYVTFMASIFRSTRFGADSAHGRANMIAFNTFEEMGAFERDEESGLYRVNFEAMRDAVTALAQDILMIQGDGDYRRADELIAALGRIGPTLEGDLQRLEEAGIPVDVIFEQGPEVAGLH